MRNRTWLTLAFIVVLAIVSGWIALPGSDFDIAGFRAAHPIRRGLDLQGGLQVVLQARPVAGQTARSRHAGGHPPDARAPRQRSWRQRAAHPDAGRRPDHRRATRRRRSARSDRDPAADRATGDHRPAGTVSTAWNRWSTRRSGPRRTPSAPRRSAPTRRRARLRSRQPLWPMLAPQLARSTKPSSAALTSRMPTSPPATPA